MVKTKIGTCYQAAMRAKGVQEFNLGTLEAYVNTRVLAEGLERAGADPTRSKLRTALASIRNLDLGGAHHRLQQPGPLRGVPVCRYGCAQRLGPFRRLIASASPPR